MKSIPEQVKTGFVKRGLCGLMLASAMGGLTVAAEQAGAGVSTRNDAPRPGGNQVTIVGCLQRDRGSAQTGTKSPSGFVLMNSSTNPYGGSAGAGGSDRVVPATPPAGNNSGVAGPGDSAPRAGGGGAGVSPGLTYLLDGKDFEAHAGERVEVTGTLQQPASKEGAMVPQVSRAGAPTAPQVIQVASLRTVAKDCVR